MSNSKHTKISISDLIETPKKGDSNQSRQSSLNSAEFKLECSFSGCKRRFPNMDSLQAHKRRSHAAPTPFKCTVCHETYSSKQNLAKHVSCIEKLISVPFLPRSMKIYKINRFPRYTRELFFRISI